MDEIHLTPEAKLAMQSYILKMVAAPVAIIGIISFLLGFLIKDWAYEKAYREAYTKAFLTAQQDLSDLSLEIGKVAADAKQNSAQLKAAALDAELIKSKLKTAQAFQKAEKFVEDVKKSILERSDFKSDITETINESVTKNTSDIKTINESLKNYVEVNEKIQIFNPGSGLNLDLKWPRNGKPKSSDPIQAHTVLKNKAQTWQIKRL